MKDCIQNFFKFIKGSLHFSIHYYIKTFLLLSRIFFISLPLVYTLLFCFPLKIDYNINENICYLLTEYAKKEIKGGEKEIPLESSEYIPIKGKSLINEIASILGVPSGWKKYDIYFRHNNYLVIKVEKKTGGYSHHSEYPIDVKIEIEDKIFNVPFDDLGILNDKEGYEYDSIPKNIKVTCSANIRPKEPIKIPAGDYLVSYIDNNPPEVFVKNRITTVKCILILAASSAFWFTVLGSIKICITLARKGFKKYFWPNK